MKITFNTPNNIPIVVEGTPEQINETIDHLMGIALKRITKSVPTIVTEDDNKFSPAVVENFLNGIFVYRANPNSQVGKPRAIAEILCDGATHSIANVAKRCNAVESTVVKNIAHMRMHGAIIDVDGDNATVKMIPTKRLPKRRMMQRKKNVATSELHVADLSAAIANLKLG